MILATGCKSSGSTEELERGIGGGGGGGGERGGRGGTKDKSVQYNVQHKV